MHVCILFYTQSLTAISKTSSFLKKLSNNSTTKGERVYHEMRSPLRVFRKPSSTDIHYVNREAVAPHKTQQTSQENELTGYTTVSLSANDKAVSSEYSSCLPPRRVNSAKATTSQLPIYDVPDAALYNYPTNGKAAIERNYSTVNSETKTINQVLTSTSVTLDVTDVDCRFRK